MADHFNILMSMARDAGRIALSLAGKMNPELKPDASVITEADRAVSAMAHQRLKPLIDTGDHVLIDEEDPLKGKYLDDDFLEAVPYVWSIDPIDGTRVYANHMPHYGVSIGLIKDRKPWMGVVYFPALKELFCCDGNEAYLVENAFAWNAKRTLIKPVDEEITSRSVFIVSEDLGKNFTWSSPDCRYMVLSSAITEYCWPAVGRGCGSLSRVHLWDLAGSWPIVEKAGLRFRNARTGEVLDRLKASLFQTSPVWKLKEHYILSSERNYLLLRDRITFL